MGLLTCQEAGLWDGLPVRRRAYGTANLSGGGTMGRLTCQEAGLWDS